VTKWICVRRIRFISKFETSVVIDYLESLVAFDTRNGSGDEMVCIRFLEEALKKFAPDQLHVGQVPRSRGKSDSGYVLAIWGRPDTLLNVHIDTVPSGEGWTDDPLNLRREADRVIGLGTSDIKGAAACILAALETGTPKNAAVLFSGDEEHGSEVMPAVIASGQLSDVKRAIVCEPTSCRVGRAHRGMLAISAGFTGPGGHSSLADVTPRPLLNAARLAAKVGDYADVHLDFGTAPFEGLCVNIGDPCVRRPAIMSVGEKPIFMDWPTGPIWILLWRSSPLPRKICAPLPMYLARRKLLIYPIGQKPLCSARLV